MASVLYSTYLKHLHELQRYERRVTTPPFYLMIVTAFFLHIAGIALISLTHDDTLRVPLRNLKLNLGDGENLSNALSERDKALLQAAKEHKEARAKAEAEFKRKQEEKARKAKLRAERRAKQAARKRSESIDTIIKSVQEEPLNSARVASPVPSDIPMPWKQGSKGSQGISPSTLIANAKKVATGGEGGATQSGGAEQRRLELRYTEQISQVIARNKVMPAEAFEKGLKGVATLQIQMNRSGRIENLWVRKSSGHKILDDAAKKAGMRSNPLPPVPDDYSPSETRFAFSVGVIFK